jgi:hypothetical protein
MPGIVTDDTLNASMIGYQFIFMISPTFVPQLTTRRLDEKIYINNSFPEPHR